MELSGREGQVWEPFESARSLEGVAHVTEAMDLLFANRAQSYLNTADYFRNEGDWVKAYRYYRSASAMALNPRLHSEACRGLGDLFAQAGDVYQALESYGNSIHSFPNREGYYQFILLSARSGHIQEALEAAKGLTKFYPREAASWYKLAACQEMLGQKEDAQVSFQKGLRLEKAGKGRMAMGEGS